MVDEAVVRERLATLRTNARRLEELLMAGREPFVTNEDVYLKAERCLQLCIQALLDIGTHILAVDTLERPAGYEDVVPALGRAGVISKDLVDRLAGIAGLRNILVHDYLAVDFGLLFDNITGGLDDFSDFASAIEDHLGRS